MTEIISVRFRETGKAYSFDPNGMTIKKDDAVIVETSRGIEYGTVACGNHEASAEEVVAPLRKVLRIATDADRRIAEENRVKEKKAADVCQEKILEHNLEMKCIDVEYAFDGSKILFYFTADGRVDFRELVKDLAGVFKTRIELRQVGVRDEAKLLGGLGICGRPFCCATFLDDFQPVSIKMAKEQNLSLNPTKISGTCGRLMCCLKYEQEAYEDLIKTTPKVSSIVETPQGTGTVVDVSLMTGKLKVRMDDGTDLAPKTFHKCEVCVKSGACKGMNKPVQEKLPPELDALEETEKSDVVESFEKDIRKPEQSHGGKKKQYNNRKNKNKPGNNRQNSEVAAVSQQSTETKPVQDGEEKGSKPESKGGNRRRYYRNRRRPNNKGGNGAPENKQQN